MTAGVLAGIAVLGGLGAVGRFLLDGSVSRRAGRDFPYGTLVVNLTGALLLGVVAGAALSLTAYRLVAVGLIGAFTTYSTWAFETHRLAEDGRVRGGAANLGISLLLGLAAAWVGRHLGASL